MKDKNRKALQKKIEFGFFVAYLAMLCYFLFLADSLGRTYAEREYHYNLVPFKEINRFWTYRHTLPLASVWLNLAGNVIAFLPFGTFLPMIWKKFRKFWLILILSFDFTLTVEVIQLVFKVGCFDVDDMILNTLGGACGYLVFYILHAIKDRIVAAHS